MKQKPTAIKLINCKDVIVKDNIGIGDMDLLNADNVENLNTDGNILITSDKFSSKKKWYEKPLGIVLLMVIAGLIVGFLIYYFGWS